MSAEYATATNYERQFMQLLLSEKWLAEQIKANPNEPLWDQHMRRTLTIIEECND